MKNRIPIYFVQFEATPLPESADFELASGAYVNCWLSAESADKAAKLASAAVSEAGWRVLAVEQECRVVTEIDYLEDDEGLEYFEQALAEGECYVFHQWPIEDKDGQVLH